MKRYFIHFLFLAWVSISCADEKDPFDFLSCRLTKIEASGIADYLETITYDNDGNKIQYQRAGADLSNTYQYTGKLLTRVVGNLNTRDITYADGKVSFVIVKNPDGIIAFTEGYVWAGNTLTITRRDISSTILSGSTYEFNGKNVTHEIHIDFDGTDVTFKRELVYSEFDDAYNPEYLIEYPFPASLNNYGKAVITNTDYSTGGANVVINTFNYTVTTNTSKAVTSKSRVRDDGQTLVRVYTYENCP